MRTYRKTNVEKFMAENPQFALFVKSEMKLGRPMDVLSASIQDRFGYVIPRQTLQSYYSRVFKPDEDADILAYREARSQAHAWIAEMKADPEVDATKIAEVTLARQIVANSSKLADADILGLLAEQRRRMELDQRRQALELERDKLRATIDRMRQEREKVRELVTTDGTHEARRDPGEAIRKIREIYGIGGSGSAAAVPGSVDQ